VPRRNPEAAAGGFPLIGRRGLPQGMAEALQHRREAAHDLTDQKAAPPASTPAGENRAETARSAAPESGARVREVSL
jgi:hypothetical protein